MARRLGGRHWHRETLRQRLAKQLFAAAGHRIVVAGATKWAAMVAAMTEITEREVTVVGSPQWVQPVSIPVVRPVASDSRLRFRNESAATRSKARL
jgi:hypothetical protein